MPDRAHGPRPAPGGPRPAPDRADLRSGPGRVLIAVYGLFALAATARSAVQLGTRFDQAPVAYLLSAVAATIYVVATVSLANGGPLARRIALAACAAELVGVLTVGAISLAVPDAFPDATVWSAFGAGYGFVPLVLPPLGLLWIRHTARARRAARAGGPRGGRGGLPPDAQ